MSHTNESCHIWMSHVRQRLYEWVIYSPFPKRWDPSYMNESCHMWMSHVTCDSVTSHAARVWKNETETQNGHRNTRWNRVVSCCSVLQCVVAVSCCSVLSQCVAVCWWDLKWSSDYKSESRMICTGLFSHIHESSQMWMSHVTYDSLTSRTARVRKDETQHGHWNTNLNPEWSSQVSFQRAHLKRNLNVASTIFMCIPMSNNAPRHIATRHCNTLHHAAARYCNNTLQHTATHCNNTLHDSDVNSNDQQCTATHWNKTLQHIATHCNNTPLNSDDHFGSHLFGNGLYIHIWGGYDCRPLKTISLFCKRALWKRLYSEKQTYNFKEPTNYGHLISSHTIIKIIGLFCRI